MKNAIHKFKNVLGDGMRTNLFRMTVRFPFPTPEITEDTSLLITSTQTPTIKTGSPIVVKFAFGKEIKVPSVARVYDPITFTVINDDKNVFLNAFEKWLEMIAPWNTNEASSPNEIETECSLELLSVDGETVLRKYDLHFCFIENISSIKLDANSEDVQKYDITLHYVGIN